MFDYWINHMYEKMKANFYTLICTLFILPLCVQGQKISKKLTEYLEVYPQEKIYLHINKPYYASKETIWFKAYLVDAHLHVNETKSRVIYVDLIDPKGIVIASQMLHADVAQDGSFTLEPNQSSGTYFIRAYTQYMRNFDQNFFFQKAIPVFGGETEKEAIALEAGMVADEQPLKLQFFPEGGDLIAGFSMQLAFEAKSINEVSPFLQGDIIDENDQKITSFETTHEGTGFFNLKAEQGKQYRAVLFYQMQRYEFALPEVKNKGFVLKVNNTKEDRIQVKLFSTNGLKGATLLGHCRGQVFNTNRNLPEGDVISFPKDELPAGLLHFTLFDGKGRPVAERLVFNDWGVEEELLGVFQPYSFYYPRQKVELQLELSDLLKGQTANLSASVTDESVVKYSSHSETAQTYFLLNSDLKLPIANPLFYLTEIDTRKRFLLDLVLQTRGWRRFKWEDIKEEKEMDFFFSNEQGYTISGYTTSKNGEDERVASAVMLTSLSEQFYVNQLTTDESGFFKFENLPYADTVNFTLQGETISKTENKKKRKRKRKKDKNDPNLLKLQGKRDVKINLEPIFKPLVNLPKEQYLAEQPSTLAEYLKRQERFNLVDSVYSTNWQIDLEEVVVKSKRRQEERLSNAFDLNKLDWIPPNRNAINLLSTLRPGKTYRRDFTTGELMFVSSNPMGQVTLTPVKIYINNLRSSMAALNGMTADYIDFIQINGAVINVYTRPDGPRSLQARVKEGILNFSHPAYDEAREFYAPDYENEAIPESKPDLRTAIHWEPNVVLDKSGKGTLKFFSADGSSTYQVRVEGVSENGVPIFKTYSIDIKE